MSSSNLTLTVFFSLKMNTVNLVNHVTLPMEMDVRIALVNGAEVKPSCRFTITGLSFKCTVAVTDWDFLQSHYQWHPDLLKIEVGHNSRT